jgi:hypothetical protein
MSEATWLCHPTAAEINIRNKRRRNTLKLNAHQGDFHIFQFRALLAERRESELCPVGRV